MGNVLRFLSQVAQKARRFPSPDMEKEFHGKHTAYLITFSNFWLSLNVLLNLFLIAVRIRKLDWFNGQPIALAAHFIPLAILAGVLFSLNFFPELRPRCAQVLSLACVLTTAWICWSLHFITQMDLLVCKQVDIPTVWAELSPASSAELHQFLTDQLTFKQLWFSLLHVFLFLNFLHFVGLSRSTVAVYVLYLPRTRDPSKPTAFTSPVLSKNIIEALVGGLILLAYEILSGLYILITRREQFQVDYALQQALQNEAQAMQELAQQELAQKESAQRADSILNHIFKNTMADAAGCIHLFMETNLVREVSDLRQALDCLDRGIKWSRKRQALYKVTSGNYVPMLAKVNLQELGTSIVRGREIRCSFPDATVMVDPILCDIVLDNAIGNALRHGRADGPDICFTIRLCERAANPDASNLIFQVTNKADLHKPKVTKEFVAQIIGGDRHLRQYPVSALSDHLGVQHLFLAAAAHGMTLTLEQIGDTVILEASLDVQCVVPAEAPTRLASLGTALFPAGLKILCVDDSAVARRLLSHVLLQHAPGSTVQVYGADPKEVEAFQVQALAGADILILDNHLDYGDVSFLGTEILASLLRRGYSNFACVRSADVSDETRLLYLEHGAHCAIGKDASPRDMVLQLQIAYTQYSRWKERHSIGPAQFPTQSQRNLHSPVIEGCSSPSSNMSAFLLPGMVSQASPSVLLGSPSARLGWGP